MVRVNGAQRLPWATPKLQRIIAGSAEKNSTTKPEAKGASKS